MSENWSRLFKPFGTLVLRLILQSDLDEKKVWTNVQQLLCQPEIKVIFLEKAKLSELRSSHQLSSLTISFLKNSFI